MWFIGERVLVRWHDSIRVGRVSAVRENDHSVPPDCVKVRIAGIGTYTVNEGSYQYEPSESSYVYSVQQR